MMNPSCIECGATLSGRSDKKFCSDYCRATWHNRLYRKSVSEQSPVTRILRQNYAVLTRLLGSGRHRADRHHLEQWQFNPAYCTASRRDPLGRRIYSCYSYTYRLTLSGGLRILKA